MEASELHGACRRFAAFPMAQIADGTAGVIVNASPATAQVAPRHSVALTPASRPRIVDLKLDSVRLLAILRSEGIVTKADCV